MRGFFIVFCIILILASSSYSVSIDFSVYTETQDGDKRFGNIDAKPGDRINAFIYVENTNPDREDDPIEDISVSAIIEDINEGDDIEEDYDEFDLKPKRTESLPLAFIVPLRVEEKNYPIKLTIEGTDESGVDFSKSDEFLVRVKKEQHKLYLSELVMAPEKVKCNEVSYLNIGLYNMGTYDENIELNATNKKLGFSLQRSITLEKYPGDDKYENRIPVKIPSDASSGKYPFEITLSYNKGSLFMNNVTYLDVGCSSASTNTVLGEEEEEETESNEPAADVAVTLPINPAKISTERSGDSIVIPIIIGILIILAIMIILILRRNK